MFLAHLRPLFVASNFIHYADNPYGYNYNEGLPFRSYTPRQRMLDFGHYEKEKVRRTRRLRLE